MRKILLIYTGGTIGMITNAQTGALESVNFEHLHAHIPELQRFNLELSVCSFEQPVDSSEITLEHWQTMVFTVLSLSQLGHILAVRSDRSFLFKQGIFSNMPLLVSVFLTFILQLGVIYIPFMNDIFRTQPLTLNELSICIGASMLVFHAVEFEKLIKKIIK
jgi:magnesium-transporting ATPase (P-type)